MKKTGITLTFDLLIWKSIGVIYSPRTIYLPSLKLLGQSVLELSVAQGEVNWHDLWPTDLKINRDHLLTKDYLFTKFEASEAKCSWVISCTSEVNWHDLWPWPLTWKSIRIIYPPRTIYLPSLKLLGQSVIELSVAQGEGLPTYRPTDIPTDRQVQSNMPSFFKGGYKNFGTPRKVLSQAMYICNMKALPPLVKELWPRLIFFKRRSNFKV